LSHSSWVQVSVSLDDSVSIHINRRIKCKYSCWDPGRQIDTGRRPHFYLAGLMLLRMPGLDVNPLILTDESSPPSLSFLQGELGMAAYERRK